MKAKTMIQYFFIFLIPLLLLFARFCLVKFLIVSGNSMLPGLKKGNVILVSILEQENDCLFKNRVLPENSLKLSNQDLVVFRAPDNDLAVKRIIGVPGDSYSFTDSSVQINGIYLNEPYAVNQGNYISALKRFASFPFIPLEVQGRIPPRYFLLLGDNRNNSTDSRDFGLVPASSITGKVILKF